MIEEYLLLIIYILFTGFVRATIIAFALAIALAIAISKQK